MEGRILIPIVLSFLASSVSAANMVKVDVSVSCDKPTSLLVSITNTASSPVRLPEAALPWNYSKVLYVEAFKIEEGSSTRITRISPIADYLRTISLGPKQILRGEIALDHVLADFNAANESADIIVSYRIRDMNAINEVKFVGLAGMVFIKKKGLFKQACPATMALSS